MKEARNNFNLTKDKRKMDKASVKYGQLRPIFPHLVQEIILEQEELRRIRDERDENEVDSMGSVDEFGKRLSRPSRAIANAQKRKESKRPHSAAAMGRKHASITAAQKMLTSKEAPGRMSRSSMAQADGGGAGSGGEGEGTDRRRLLSKASLATVDALQDSTVPGYRRQELVPIRSSEVFLMNAEGGPATGGDQQGKTGRLQKELQQHIQNAQVLADTNGPAGPSAGVGADFGPSVGSMKAKMSSSGKHQQQRGGAFGSMSSGLDVLHEHEERTVGSGDGGSVHLSKDDPQDAAERTAALLFRSTSARSPSPSTSERCLSPSQMMLRQNSGGNNLGLEEFNSSTTGRPLVLLRQLSATKNSPFFSTSSVKDDGRIARAQQQKEDIQKQKEEDLRQRIRNKELASLSKAEMLLHEQRQRAWAVAVVTLARWR